MTLLNGTRDIPAPVIPRNLWSRLWWRACPRCGERFLHDHGWQLLAYMKHWDGHGYWDGSR